MLNIRSATWVATSALLLCAPGCDKGANDELEKQAAALAAEPISAEATQSAIAEAKAAADKEVAKAEEEAKKLAGETEEDPEGTGEAAGADGEKEDEKVAEVPAVGDEKKGLVPTLPPKVVAPKLPPKTTPPETKKGLVPTPPPTKVTPPPTTVTPPKEVPKSDPPATDKKEKPKRRSASKELEGVSKKRLPGN